MEYVDPIKDLESIHKMKEILGQQSQRDLLFFVFGINTGIKINELLSLKVKDVRGEKGLKQFLHLKDSHTNEIKSFYLNHKIRHELEKYFSEQPLDDDDYLFKSKKNSLPITRQQAYRIINQAAKKAGVSGKIGTHTLRKTFGYHAYKKGIAISIIREIFNHHSRSETLRYIGIDPEDKEPIKVDVNL